MGRKEEKKKEEKKKDPKRKWYKCRLCDKEYDSKQYKDHGSKVTRELIWLSFIGVDDHHIVVIYVIFFRHL